MGSHALVGVGLVLLVLCPPAPAAKEPDIIDVLYISRSLFQGGMTDRMLSYDPSISTYAVPTAGHYSISDLGKDPEMMNRIMRIYMPRSFEQLVDRTDLILLHEAPCGSTAFPQVFFDHRWISWFAKAVQERGMPFSMWGGDASWGGVGEGSYKSWGDTILGIILPFECLPGYNPDYAGHQLPRFVDQNHPLARLPWAESGPVELLNKVKVREGAILVAEAVGSNVAYPWIAWWVSGQGKVVGETQVFGSHGTTNRMLQYWRWYQDFVIYLVYFAADKPIPDDVYRAHRLREEINLHNDNAVLLVSLLEFVEKFGARTGQLYADLDAINRREKEGEALYRENDYDEASRVFEEIKDLWAELNEKAVQAKDKALVWVYLTEWFSVTGASLVTGFVLWSLMVKRTLYRAVGATRVV